MGALDHHVHDLVGGRRRGTINIRLHPESILALERPGASLSPRSAVCIMSLDKLEIFTLARSNIKMGWVYLHGYLPG